MKKIKTIENQENYHPEPRNDIEKFLHERLPAITNAYGLGYIKFNFITHLDKEHMCGVPEDGLLSIKYDSIYKSAYIFITPNAVELYKNKEYKTLSDGLVHEVGHIITDRLGNLASSRHTTKKDIDDTVEETTETIAHIVRVLLSKVDPVTFKE